MNSKYDSKNNIALIRYYRNITIEGLAEKTGISRPVLGKLENGINTSIGNCLKISKVLDVSLDDMFINIPKLSFSKPNDTEGE